ncbi:MAG: flagellar hook-basal body complex protein, partial [Candidatus Dadabacteria bacterium]
AYVNSEDVDASGSATGLPRLLSNGTTGDITLSFNSDGTRSNAPSSGSSDITLKTPWNNGSDSTATIDVDLSSFTQFSSTSSLLSVTQDGQGVGNITNVSIDDDGVVSSILDNGQKAVIGTIALADFANPEGLTRLGGQLYQKSNASGEPVVGKPQTGTLGLLESETFESSTVDIAAEFVKLITLQRGFQANSRIITTINQLLNEIIGLA